MKPTKHMSHASPNQNCWTQGYTKRN